MKFIFSVEICFGTVTYFASLEFFFFLLLPLKLAIMFLALTVVKVGVIISKITFILKQKFLKSEARFHMKLVCS